MTDFPNILFKSKTYLWMTSPKLAFLTSQASLDRVDILNQTIEICVNYEVINDILNSCGNVLELEVRNVTFGNANDYENGRAVAYFRKCSPETFFINGLTTPYVLCGDPQCGDADILQARLTLKCEIEFVG